MAKRIQLLDCTLRDGGYLNDWRFGHQNILDTAQSLTNAGIDIVELGFMREQPADLDRAVWNDFSDVAGYIPEDRKNTMFAVMCEMFNPFPIEKIPYHSNNGIDIIRVIVWRQFQDQALEYCDQIAKRGYRVSIQPDRVNQYSPEELVALAEKFSQIQPWAFYLVDSNGFLNQEELLRYLHAVDNALDKKIILGYHGHNNLQQAIGTAEQICRLNTHRQIIIDGSVTGIGRSSGNLNLELIAEYMNSNFQQSYNIFEIARIYDKVLVPMESTVSWGYSFGTFLTSAFRVNPNYARALKDEYHLSYYETAGVLTLISQQDRVIFNRKAIPDYIARYKKQLKEQDH